MVIITIAVGGGLWAWNSCGAVSTGSKRRLNFREVLVKVLEPPSPYTDSVQKRSMTTADQL